MTEFAQVAAPPPGQQEHPSEQHSHGGHVIRKPQRTQVGPPLSLAHLENRDGKTIKEAEGARRQGVLAEHRAPCPAPEHGGSQPHSESHTQDLGALGGRRSRSLYREDG